jgi:hypothetical protein
MNVVVDGKGTVRRRPGIATYSKAPTTVIDANGIQGIRASQLGGLYCVSGNDGTLPSSNSIYKLTAGGAANLSTLPNTDVRGNTRVVIAETGALLVFAAGEEMQKLVLTTDVSSRLGGTPPEATHVVANASRLLANDPQVDTGKIRYSDIDTGTTYAGHETWSFGGTGFSGFLDAQARPDPVVALGENTNEVFAFGATNVQIFTPTLGDWVYDTLATREFGCSAAYSVIKVDQNFAWLDHRRRFVISDGRSFEVISEEISQDLDDMTTVSDCYGFRIHEGPIDCLVWKFPTDGRTYAYQFKGGWSQWMGWDSTGNVWKDLVVNTHHFNTSDDTNLVGTSDGKIGQMDMATNTDLGDQIVASVETGYMDRGTERRKHCTAVFMTFERGETTGTSTPVGFLQYSDYPGSWSAPISISFGGNADRYPFVRLRSLGVYRRRAWKFTFSAAEDLVLSKVTEEFEVLDT